MSYKLSVCITCYNQIEYIVRAVESVRNQKMNFPYEILIGDDGSNDGSYQLIIEKYGDIDNIRIFQQDRDENTHEFPNFRHARLIIKLLKEVRGEYFIVLDGDDYYCDLNSFQRKVNILTQPENQDCVLCMSNFKYVYDDGSEQIANSIPLITKRTFEESLFGKGKESADTYCSNFPLWPTSRWPWKDWTGLMSPTLKKITKVAGTASGYGRSTLWPAVGNARNC